MIRRSALDDSDAGLPSYLGYAGHAQGAQPAQHATDVLDLRHGQDAALDRGSGRARRHGGAGVPPVAVIYDVIDGSDGFYSGPAQRNARSRTNVVFRLPSPDLDGRFLAEARDAGLLNLKGHRSVGGMRASIYNAMPDEGVDELAGFMRDFAHSAR